MGVWWAGQHQLGLTAMFFEGCQDVQSKLYVLSPGDTHGHKQDKIAFHQAQMLHQAAGLMRKSQQGSGIDTVVYHMDALQWAFKQVSQGTLPAAGHDHIADIRSIGTQKIPGIAGMKALPRV